MKPMTSTNVIALCFSALLLTVAGPVSAQTTEPASEEFSSIIQPGLYAAPELNNQGLIIARQGNAVAAYPLIYDEAGNSRWFFSGTLLNEDGTFDADLYALSDGRCLGCPVPMAPPTLEIVGSIAIDGSDPLEPEMTLVTGEEDDLNEQTVAYEPVVFGHITYDLYGEKVAGLEGKWALTLPEDPENIENCPQELTGFVFDMQFENYIDLQVIITDPPPPALLFYQASSTNIDNLFSFSCSAQYSERFAASDRPFCIISSPDADSGEPVDRFYAEILSTNRLRIWPFAEPATGNGLFGVNIDGCSQTAVRIQ